MVYLYTPITAAPQPGEAGGVIANELPVESQIQYYDFGGTTPIRTVNKLWLDVFRLQSEQTTLENGQISKVTYPTYSAGIGPSSSGSQATEKDEFDFGQGTPTRKTTTTYQSFAGTPGIITDRPCRVVIYTGSTAV